MDFAIIEPRMMALWKVDVTLAYKRRVLTGLMDAICAQPNQTTTRLINTLRNSCCFNLTRVEFDCAIASLLDLDVIGVAKNKFTDDSNEAVYHVNPKRRNARVWTRYTRYVEENPAA